MLFVYNIWCVVAIRCALIDMEWITRLQNDQTGESEAMEVEIGHQSKMEIHTVRKLPMSSSSRRRLYLSIWLQMNGEAGPYEWDEKISDEEAKFLLEQHFYPFKKVWLLTNLDRYDGRVGWVWCGTHPTQLIYGTRFYVWVESNQFVDICRDKI